MQYVTKIFKYQVYFALYYISEMGKNPPLDIFKKMGIQGKQVDTLLLERPESGHGD
jgi:hypothetical protein